MGGAREFVAGDTTGVSSDAGGLDASPVDSVDTSTGPPPPVDAGRVSSDGGTNGGGGGIPGCPEQHLGGIWELRFKTEQSPETTLGMTLKPSGDPATCYTGKVVLKGFGTKFGTVESAKLEGSDVVIVIPDFFIPAALNPVTGKDAKAELRLTATKVSDDAMCGTVIFTPDFSPLSAYGDFAAVKELSDYSLSGPTCGDVRGP